MKLLSFPRNSPLLFEILRLKYFDNSVGNAVQLKERKQNRVAIKKEYLTEFKNNLQYVRICLVLVLDFRIYMIKFS